MVEVPNYGGRRTKYLIEWVGYDEPQWEFAESGNLANCQELIDDYERDNTLRVKPFVRKHVSF